MGIPPKRKVVWEVGSVPWRNLTANKMRTFLTVLGIAVGIATGFYPAKKKYFKNARHRFADCVGEGRDR